MAAIREVKKENTYTGGCLTSFDLEGNEIFVYQPKDIMESDIINHGYSAPLLLVMGDGKFTGKEAVDYAESTKIAKIAQENGAVVVFVNPKDSWDNEEPGVYENVLNKTKVKQWGFANGMLYDDKKPRNRFEEEAIKNNPNFDPEPEYFIFASPVATYVYTQGKSADFMAKNYLREVKGKASMGDLGFADITMTGITLRDLSVIPEVSCEDVSIVSVNNPQEINDVLLASKNRVAVCESFDAIKQYDDYLGDYKRWAGKIRKSVNYRKEGIIMKPERIMLKTKDNHFVTAPEREVGYVLFYGNDIDLSDREHPVPLLLCFHGGGDTAIATAIIGQWPEIAKENRFILCAPEMHLQVTASETMDIVKALEEKYPIDPSRIYATGFSMGGIKSWDFYQEFPECFAAIAPMCASVDVGENCQFNKSWKVNEDTLLPTFYVGGEQSPLGELPAHQEKCLNRVAYTFRVNKVVKPYTVRFEEKDSWEDPMYGVTGDSTEVLHDEDFPQSATTVRNFVSEDGNVYTQFVSVSQQQHEIRPFTCRLAWKFLKQFRRNEEGQIEFIR